MESKKLIQESNETIYTDESQVADAFHKIEIKCIGYDNYVDCSEENFIKTLEELRQLISQIQKMSIFSPNEEIKEIHTENLKLLMAPYYQADLLFRIMDNRAERVKLAHIFYIEYLGLLNHYGVLDKGQAKQWKSYMNKHKVSSINEMKNATPEEVLEAKKLLEEINAERTDAFTSRDQKIAEFKAKKEIEKMLDMLKDYKDEQMKRDFYMGQIKKSVFISFEQLGLVQMELQMLKHKASLTPEQIAENEKKSAMRDPKDMPPMQVQHITKESLSNIPYMMRPQKQANDGFENTDVVNTYKDPSQRVIIDKSTIDKQIDLRNQYKEQVFRPGHNQPTKTLEELAEEEYADAMQRKQAEDEAEMARAMEDPDDEEVLERERQKKMKHEDWADFVPKGRGVTKQI